MSEHRHTPPGTHEHEFEAAPGLPAPLPQGERLLWQGAPEFWPIAVRSYHVRKVAVYFAVLFIWRAIAVYADTASAGKALLAVAWLSPLALFALGTLLALAWLTVRTTMYTITTKRIVMRIGIVLTITFNLPLRKIVAAGLLERADGNGDIPLQLAATDKIAWVHLWPHCRPWRLAKPEPMLRGLADVRSVAQTLARAWVAANELPATTLAPAAAAPAVPTAPREPEAHGLLARLRRRPLATAH
ncbi:MAG: photosynthetic complex putative assembly protein PuhB [Betaproteobacteria bacterium]|jgi:hypothetical protein